LKDQKINVDVVSMHKTPLQVLGKEVGESAQRIQEENGVKFHLENGI
jgi:hypothetical protein